MNDTDLFGFIRSECPNGEVARVERVDGEETVVRILCGRPGILIGKRGAGVVALREKIEERIGPHKLEIIEIRKRELEPVLMVDAVVRNLERGVAMDRVLDRQTSLPIRAGASGCRLEISGALGDFEVEVFAEGSAGPLDRSAANHAEGGFGKDGDQVRVEVWILSVTSRQ